MATDFFGEMPEWSARKHSLIKKYVDGAARILGSNKTGRTMYYIDGFAGCGRYGDPQNGKSYEPGSPVLIANIAKESQERGYGYKLRCINVEAEKTNFDSLQESTAPYDDLVRNFYGEFADHVDEILKIVRGQPVVAFLDPFGIKGMPMSVVERLLSRQEPTDIWLRLDLVNVFRKDGWYENGKPYWRSHFALIADAYGIQDYEKLHNLLLPTEPPDIRRHNAGTLYMKQLLSKFPPGRLQQYAGSYRIGSIKDELKYYLVFAAAHVKALLLASDIISSEEEAYQRDMEEYAESQTTQMSLFSLTRQTDEETMEKAKIKEITGDILRLCAGRTLTRMAVQRELCGDSWFGRMRRAELTKALKKLENEGKLEVLSNTVGDMQAQLRIGHA